MVYDPLEEKRRRQEEQNMAPSSMPSRVSQKPAAGISLAASQPATPIQNTGIRRTVSPAESTPEMDDYIQKKRVGIATARQPGTGFDYVTTRTPEGKITREKVSWFNEPSQKKPVGVSKSRTPVSEEVTVSKVDNQPQASMQVEPPVTAEPVEEVQVERTQQTAPTLRHMREDQAPVVGTYDFEKTMGPQQKGAFSRLSQGPKSYQIEAQGMQRMMTAKPGYIVEKGGTVVRKPRNYEERQQLERQQNTSPMQNLIENDWGQVIQSVRPTLQSASNLADYEYQFEELKKQTVGASSLIPEVVQRTKIENMPPHIRAEYEQKMQDIQFERDMERKAYGLWVAQTAKDEMALRKMEAEGPIKARNIGLTSTSRARAEGEEKERLARLYEDEQLARGERRIMSEEGARELAEQAAFPDKSRRESLQSALNAAASEEAKQAIRQKYGASTAKQIQNASNGLRLTQAAYERAEKQYQTAIKPIGYKDPTTGEIVTKAPDYQKIQHLQQARDMAYKRMKFFENEFDNLAHFIPRTDSKKLTVPEASLSPDATAKQKKALDDYNKLYDEAAKRGFTQKDVEKLDKYWGKTGITTRAKHLAPEYAAPVNETPGEPVRATQEITESGAVIPAGLTEDLIKDLFKRGIIDRDTALAMARDIGVE